MQIRRVGYGVKGFGRITDWAIRWACMISDKAKHKLRVIVFLEKHGEQAAKEAFGLSRRTLYAWKSQLKAGGNKAEGLNEKSRRPHKVRTRKWPIIVIKEISRVREEHPNLGKEKIYVHLQSFCAEKGIKCPSIRTIGRIIFDAPDKMRTFPQKVGHNGNIVRLKRSKITRKPKGFRAKYPGHCVSLDTVEFRIWGQKFYVITMIDLFSRYGFAYATSSHASKAAKEFFDRSRKTFPYPIASVLTDNGSEFLKDFDTSLRNLCLTHWHTYPRTPKMNAHCERFNRTIQDEFFITNKVLLHNLPHCNLKLNEYIDWYNLRRPHHSLDLLSPKQFITNWEQTHKIPEECNM